MRLRVLVTLLTFMFISLFGMNLTMNMDKNDKMSNCPFMNHSSSICQMSTKEHIAKWQALFTATSPSGSFFLLAALLTVAFTYTGLKRRTNLQFSSDYAYRYYLYKRKDVKLFDYLTQAFSDGDLHPKLYN